MKGVYMGKIKMSTKQQKEIHNKAVSLRKLSDERLCEMAALAEKVKEQPSTEEVKLKETTVNVDKKSVSEFLNALGETKIAGIGKVTLKKIRDFADEQGF